MPDAGWTRHMDHEADAAHEKFGRCLICGEEIHEDDDEESHEVSNGPGEPAIGAVHHTCLEDDNPYAPAAGEYHMDLYPDVITNDIGEREL